MLDPARLRALQAPRRATSSCTTRSPSTSSGWCSPPATRPVRRCPSWPPLLAYGASPRATLGLVAAARALALLRGRDYVLPDDVRDLAVDVLAHRLVLSFDAVADGVAAEAVVRPAASRRCRRPGSPPATRSTRPTWRRHEARASAPATADRRWPTCAPPSGGCAGWS